LKHRLQPESQPLPTNTVIRSRDVSCAVANDVVAAKPKMVRAAASGNVEEVVWQHHVARACN
jgi:hypothetical protein